MGRCRENDEVEHLVGRCREREGEFTNLPSMMAGFGEKVEVDVLSSAPKVLACSIINTPELARIYIQDDPERPESFLAKQRLRSFLEQLLGS